MKHTTHEAVALLQQLIATPSHSRDEAATATLLEGYFTERGIAVERIHNNILVRSAHFDPMLPTLLLNSHHDTVRPAASYTRDPYLPTIEGDRLYGLGANDAGASVVALTQTFLHFYEQPLPFNLLLALSAEEECGGEKGVRAWVNEVGPIDSAIVGEPTSLQAAIGERGLVVLDCEAKGVSGHAAREEGVNALYLALDDIQTLRTLRPERTSPTLGPMTITTTMISCGTQHNVVPDSCRFVVDCRTTDAYTNEEVVELIRSAIRSEATPRSTRIRASVIAENHPLVEAAVAVGASCFVSPTTSDRTLMPFPALKIGPGDSKRSHSADEFVLISEIEQGIETYTKIIAHLIAKYGN